MSNPVLVAHSAATTTSFIDSIGVCGTSDAAAATMLSYLGIDHLRTNLTTVSSLLAAGSSGAKMDVIVPIYLGAVTTSTLQTLLTKIDAAASVVESVEGPNEVNVDPDSFNGMTGVAGIDAEQREIYALVKGDTTLNNSAKSTAVYEFTVLQGTPPSTYGDMSAYADSVNVHAYGGPGMQPSFIIPYVTNPFRVAGKPLVLTETGATTIATTGGVSEVMQARYDVKALLDAYSLNVARTYLFNLQDWASASDTNDFSAHYGLYNVDGSIKLAGTALHNLTTVLSRTTPGAVGTSDTLSYALSGLPTYGRTELFSKAGGVFDLAVWNETTDWNPNTRSEVAIPTNHLTLTLANIFESVAVYDPLVSTAPIAMALSASSITLDLNNDPLIIEVAPIGTAALALNQPNAATTPISGAAPPISSPSGGSDDVLYRFFDSLNGAQFLTSSAAERNTVMATRPDLIPEGAAIGTVAQPAADPNAVAIYRFFDTTTGTHFYTASGDERDQIVSARPDLISEGNAFYEHQNAAAGDAPVYRFFDQNNGTHFYTASQSERSSILATRPDMTPEGISFYAPAMTGA